MATSNAGPSSTSHTSPSPTIASESIEQQLAAGLVSGLLFAIVCVGIIILVVCGWRRFTSECIIGGDVSVITRCVMQG